MIALDIDGTLLETGTPVPQPTAEAVAAVRAAGHHVVLATGRSLTGALPVAKSLGLERAWIVASNGAITAYVSSAEPGGYSLHDQRTFDVDPVARLARTRMPRVRMGVEQVGWGWRVNKQFDPGRLNGEQRVVTDLEELWATPATRMALCAPGVAALIEPLRLLGVTATPVDHGWVDVTPRGLSKATALEAIRVRLDVPPDCTVALGDSWNDVEMLRWAAHPVAMGQAPAAIKGLVKDIAGSIEEHGAAAILQAIAAPPQRHTTPV